MNPKFTLRHALHDRQLLGHALPGVSFYEWRTVLLAAMGEPLFPSERKIFQKYTGGRLQEPLARVDEAALIIGRRGGKDRAAATLAAFIAGLCEHPSLAKGERGLCLLLAPDQRQATVTLNYIVAIFEQSKLLKRLIVNRTQDTLSLSNGVDIEVRSASFRRIRGVTAVCIIASEVAFFYDSETGSTNADTEILNAVRPTLATTGGPLILISSPHARRGELWNIYRKHYGPKGDPRILVVQGTSLQFNRTLSPRVVERALERDPAHGNAEYNAIFRTDIETFISIEAVRDCVSEGVRERAPLSNTRYFGFCDPSGGSQDAMTLGIAHREGTNAALDALREARPPFSPQAVVDQFVSLLRSYRISRVRGDRYSGEFVRELFRKRGVEYHVSEKTKSEHYLELLAAINSKRVDLLDHDRMLAQLTSLERRNGSGGKSSVDHMPGAHDDLANVVAGAVNLALAEQHKPLDAFMSAPTVIYADGDRGNTRWGFVA